MLAGFIGIGTILVVAIILFSSGGVRTPPAHKTTDKDTRDMPGYLD
jgi:hypothetical protein